MDDRRTAEGLEHLQAAANELLAAARSFLDVAEDVIADPDRFGVVAAGAVDMLKGFTGRGEQPWERHAREAGEWEADEPTYSGPGAPAKRQNEAVPEPEAADSKAGDSAPEVAEGEAQRVGIAVAEKPATKVKKPATKPRSPRKASASRVKRIVVD